MRRSLIIFVTATWITGRANAQTTAPVLPAVAASAPTTPAPLERATDDAVARLYAQIAAERVDGLPIGEVIDRVGGRAAVMDGLAQAQQIGGPRSVGDGLVQVNLEIRGDSAAALIEHAVQVAPEKCPIPPHRLSASLTRWSSRSFRSTGDNIDTGSAVADANPHPVGKQASEPTVGRLILPDLAPAWTRDAQTASGISLAKESPLLTARAAEHSARAALREQLGKLSLDNHNTLATAPKPAADAIDLAVAAARIAGVDYHADGSVEVRVSIDGQQVWQTLQMMR